MQSVNNEILDSEKEMFVIAVQMTNKEYGHNHVKWCKLVSYCVAQLLQCFY